MIYELVVILILAVGILLLLRGKGVRISSADKAKVYKAWTQVRELENGDDHAKVRAIMEADKLLDWCLQLIGIPGHTMGDRLKNSRGVLRNLDDVWKAHKLRNQLAHELDARPGSGEVHAAVRAFELAIKQVGLL